MITGVYDVQVGGKRPKAIRALTISSRVAVFAFTAATLLQPIGLLGQSARFATRGQPRAVDIAQDDPGEQQEQAKPRDQRVTGKVVDRDGKAADRAQISFAGPTKDKVWTDARGNFSFVGPSGEYQVTVNAGARHQSFVLVIENNKLKPSTLIIEPEDSGRQLRLRGLVVNRDGVAQQSQVDFYLGPDLAYRLISNGQGYFYMNTPRFGAYRVVVVQGTRQSEFRRVTLDESGLHPPTLVVPW